jgi:hypothetical protein
MSAHVRASTASPEQLEQPANSLAQHDKSRSIGAPWRNGWNTPGPISPVKCARHFCLCKRVRALIELGDLSQLDERTDPTGPHHFEYRQRQPGVCVAYGRDRGDPDTDAAVHDTVEAFYAELADSWEEWAYLWRDGHWYCSPIGGGAGPFMVDARDPAGEAPAEWLTAADWLAIERGERERPRRGAAYAVTARPVGAPILLVATGSQLRLF